MKTKRRIILKNIQLNKVMKQPIFYREVTEQCEPANNDVIHHTENYVDDSTNNIGADSLQELEEYVGDYMKLLYAVYDANFLQLNVIGTRGWTNVFFYFGLFGPYILLFNAFGSGVLFLLLWRYLKSR